MRFFTVLVASLALLLAACSREQAVEASAKPTSSSKEAPTPPQLILPDDQKIIDRPLTPDTGRYIEHGTDIPMPEPPKGDKPDDKKEDKRPADKK